MNEQTQTSGRPKPVIQGKVISILPEWRNDSGSFWKQSIVVETGLRFPNPIKVTFQKEGTSHLEGIAAGDCVIIPYYLNGRQWDGPNGTQYFIDIVGMGLQKITGAGDGVKNGAETKPVMGCTAATAIEAWAKKHGDDKAGFAEFCKALKPGKPSKTYTIADWADVVNAINKAGEPQPQDDGADDFDDLPF